MLMAALGMGGRGTRGWAMPARSEREALLVDAATAAVELGSGLDVVDADGNTALHRAADEGLEPVVKLLTERGANAEIKNNKGKTALEDAWPPSAARPARRRSREGR